MPSSLLSVGTPSNLPTNSQKLHLVEEWLYKKPRKNEFFQSIVKAK